jgi:uncharacterized membrane protein YfcA
MIVGIITGLSSGLFGIGGALIGTPLLRVLAEMPPLLAIATPLPVAIPSAVSGAVMYWRGYVDRDLVSKTLRIALPMTVIGSLVTHWTPGVWLMVTTAVVLVYTGIAMVRKRSREGLNVAVSSNRRINVSISVAGFLAGFLVIGGGIVLVPVYVRWLGVPIHRALATSLVCGSDGNPWDTRSWSSRSYRMGCSSVRNTDSDSSIVVWGAHCVAA